MLDREQTFKKVDEILGPYSHLTADAKMQYIHIELLFEIRDLLSHMNRETTEMGIRERMKK